MAFWWTLLFSAIKGMVSREQANFMATTCALQNAQTVVSGSSFISCGLKCLRNESCSRLMYCPGLALCGLGGTSGVINNPPEGSCTCYARRKYCRNDGFFNNQGMCQCTPGVFGSECENRVTDCSSDLVKDPEAIERYGTVYIYPESSPAPFAVLCDFTFGLSLIQVRTSQSCPRVSFHRFWQDYKDGFGDFGCDFWLGLEKIHQITSNGVYTLIVLVDDGRTYRQCFYNNFKVDSEATDYRATLTDSDPGCNDLLGPNGAFGINGLPFSALDHDSTIYGCASTMKSGWWFTHTCPVANPNGPYLSETDFLSDPKRARIRVGGHLADSWIKDFTMRLERLS